ncbi:flagellar biosynthesis protein FlhG [Natronincola peptidivorans]|uniref:Flagellar biosynthesis protein FlhG n=1 Tax=Natronincola peptidivorans TaxID=426128 RepID=A0A1H9YFS7_9FIRM|nr:MinD/ParA family protein [Natronincola peptidivorans]SES67857.1 flagellar biosynthesis protein FlhG [Natronincola peptidivorans]
MTDQATKLRELISKKKLVSKKTLKDENIPQKKARVICVTSGKGGVGKTNFTANLAIALQKKDKKVVIIDADLGLANLDVVLGVIPKYTLLDVLNKGKNITEIMNNGPSGVQTVSGGSGIIDLVDISKEKLDTLISQFNKINDYADIILIDTGAGLSKSVLSFVLSADEVIIVTTAEPTSLTDAYAMIKAIGMQEKDKNIRVVINQVESINEGKATFEKLKNACEKFLGKNIEKLGFLSRDANVTKAVKLQKPFILQFPNTAASKNIEVIALKLSNGNIEDEGFNESNNFISKIISLFR